MEHNGMVLAHQFFFTCSSSDLGVASISPHSVNPLLPFVLPGLIISSTDTMASIMASISIVSPHINLIREEQA
jgi:hypothetical protein